MDLKGYFKPNKEKILNSAVLFGIAVLVSLPLYLPIILFATTPVFMIIITILVAYLFACYISKTKNWLKGMTIYLVVFIIMSIGIFFAISLYNDAVGHYCSADSDCYFICGQGAVNKKYIPLMDPFLIVDCFMSSAICENNQCKTFDVKEAASLEDCERVNQKNEKQMCYYYLAKKLNNENICSKIEARYLKENCIKQVIE
jgi:hypothetical protein